MQITATITLDATTTGTKQVSVTVTGNTDAIKLAVASYTGNATSSPLQNYTGAYGSSGNPAATLTGVIGNGLVTATLSRHSTTGATTNRSSIYNDNVASTLGAASYQVATTNGTYTDTYTGSAASDWSMVIAAFKAATSTTSSNTSPDATSTRTTLWKDSNTTTFGGASYTIATTSGTITDTYNTLTSTNWVMAAIALRPATSTSGGGGSSTGTTTRYFHQDHLNSTNVTSDKLGNRIQVLDYYPYGATRITSTTGANESKQFIGQVTDPETNLSYLQARYLNSTNGQFISQDPTHLAIGTSKLTEILNRVNGGRRQDDREALRQFLADPQLMNSYGYARGNPITNKDVTGEAIPLIPILAAYGWAQLGVDLYDAYNMNIRYADVTSQDEKSQSKFKAAFGIFTIGVGGAAELSRIGMKEAGFRLGVFQVFGDALDSIASRQIYQNMNYSQIQSQPTIQARQDYAQRYNSTFGLSTGGGGTMPSGNSLWVTPSGAVVSFDGKLVAAPPSKK